MITFYKYLLAMEAGEAPPPPAPGADAGGAGAGGPPPPDPTGGGGDPLAGLGGGGGPGGGPPPPGDPMGGGGAGGAPGQTRKAINITTWEDALKHVLGKDAHREPKSKQHTPEPPKEEKKKPKSLLQ